MMRCGLFCTGCPAICFLGWCAGQGFIWVVGLVREGKEGGLEVGNTTMRFLRTMEDEGKLMCLRIEIVMIDYCSCL